MIQQKKYVLDSTDFITYKICLTLVCYTNENKIERNLKQPYIPDDLYRLLEIGGSGSGKTNALLSATNKKPDIGKIHLYAKDLYEANFNI